MNPGLRALEDKYEVLERIGGGGMGTVYKVRHRLLDELRVVKVMGAHLVGSEEYRERFLREARTAIKLRHPNTATLYDFSIDDSGAAYMIIELIDGVNMAELLRLTGPPPIGLLLEIACQSLEAIGYLHRKGLVHRDIAPDNLMLTRDDEGNPHIKLIDLGIVKGIETGVNKLTRSGLYLGKLHYSAPEQFGGGDPTQLEARSDLYSFGAVLYEVATGTCPFTGDSPAAIIAAHLFHGPLPFRKTDPQNRLPGDFKEIVLKAMERDPRNRSESAEQLIAAFAPLRARYPVEQDALTRILAARQQNPPGGGSGQHDRTTHKGAAAPEDEVAAPPIAVLDEGPFVDDQAPSEPNGDIADEIDTAIDTTLQECDPTDRIEAALLKGAHKLLDLGHTDEAQQQLEVLLRLTPGHEEARQLLEEITRSTGSQENQAMAALVTSINAHLARGDLATAASLLDSVEDMIGHSRVLQRLRSRIDQEQQERQHLSSMIDDLLASSAMLGPKPGARPPAAVTPPALPRQARAGQGTAQITAGPLGLDREIAAATASVEECLRQGNLEEAARALQLASRLCGDRDVFRSLQVRIDRGLEARRRRSTKVGRLVRNAQKSAVAGDFETALSFLEQATALDSRNPEVSRLREDAEQIYVQVSRQRRAEIETWPGLAPPEE